MYISGFLIFVIVVLVISWWGTAKRQAVDTAVAITSEIHHRFASRALDPFLEVVAAAWLEAVRWRSQLEEAGKEPVVDRTLNVFALRAAERFAEASAQLPIVGEPPSVHELLAEMMSEELENIVSLAEPSERSRWRRTRPAQIPRSVAKVEAPIGPQPASATTKPAAPDIANEKLELADDVVVALKLDSPADFLRAAQTRHYAKSFNEAKYLYALLLDRHPQSKEAAAARTQLQNLKDIVMKVPGFDRFIGGAKVSAKPVDVHSPAAMLRAAQELHFAKSFAEAKVQYAAIVEKYPQSDEARAARQQLDNLRGT